MIRKSANIGEKWGETVNFHSTQGKCILFGNRGGAKILYSPLKLFLNIRNPSYSRAKIRNSTPFFLGGCEVLCCRRHRSRKHKDRPDRQRGQGGGGRLHRDAGASQSGLRLQVVNKFIACQWINILKPFLSRDVGNCFNLALDIHFLNSVSII